MEDFQHLDDYAVLGVDSSATPDELKRAFRREIAKYHPDRYRSADPQAQQYARERSQRITEAYASVTRSPRSRTRPAPSNIRTPVATSAAQLAADYDQAQTLLAAGRADEAARLLRQVQKIDPFYRDVDDLLARAEELAQGRTRAGSRRGLFVGLGAGALALALIGGGLYGSGLIGSPQQAQQPGGTGAQASNAAATNVAVAELPSAVGSAPGAAVTSPAPASVAAVASVAPTEAPPPTEVPPTEAPPPTEVPPTAVPPTETPAPTEAPPPTEIPPPPTEIPPTAVPPTAVPPPPPVVRPTAVPPTAVPPTARPARALEGGPVLTADTFSDPASGWTVLQEPNYSLGYRGGSYAITSVPGTGGIFSYGSPLGQNNAIIGADVTPVRGSAGLVFGPNNSYRFVVAANGSFRVERQGSGVIVPQTPSRAVRAGVNRLVIAAAGTRVSLYANGTLLRNLDLAAPLGGTTYGFIVIAGPGGGEGIFDNLTVRALPPR